MLQLKKKKKDAITLPVPVTVTNSRDNEYPVKQNNVALHVKWNKPVI